MSHLQPVLTERLDLRCPDPRRDLEELFVIFSDPDGWWYDPAGRHVEPERTREWLSRAASRFDSDGLSYWTVRLRDGGTIIGVGGAQRQRTGAWVAERLGLTNYGVAVDPSDNQPRLAYADRPIGIFSGQPR